jgi:hypothetical protein
VLGAPILLSYLIFEPVHRSSVTCTTTNIVSVYAISVVLVL